MLATPEEASVLISNLTTVRESSKPRKRTRMFLRRLYLFA
jgi:hypothetical protein